MAIQYSTEMGMHSNYNYNNSVYYFRNIIGSIIFFLIIILVVITIFKVFSILGPKKCNRCGLIIESEEWLICPRCGNSINDGSVR